MNEFLSERWDGQSDTVLTNLGFIGPDSEPFGSEWMGYAFAYTIPYTLLCWTITGINLTFIRVEGGTAVEPPSTEKKEKKERIELPFKPVTLSFRKSRQSGIQCVLVLWLLREPLLKHSFSFVLA